MPSPRCVLLSVLVTIALARCAAAQDQVPAPSIADLAGHLPADTLAVADLIDAPACHAALARLVEPVPAALRPALAKAAAFVQFGVRFATGMGVEELERVLAPRQVVVALVPQADLRAEPATLLLARVLDTAPVAELLERLAGKVAARLDGGVLTVAANQAQLDAAFAFRGSGRPSLLARTGWREQRAELVPGAGVRVWVDVAALRRRAPPAKSYFDNLDGGGRFFVGALADVLDRATRFDGVLRLRDDGLRFEGRFDASPLSGRTARSHASGAGVRAVPAAPAGALAVVSLDRSLRGLYGALDEILAADEAAQARAGLSILDTILGVPFVERFLGALEEPATLFVVPGPAAGDGVRDPLAPRLDLPAFVLTAKMADPKLEQWLLRGWHALSAIQFAERQQRGQLPFQLRKLTERDYRVTTFELPEWSGPGAAPTEQALTPSLLFAHGTAIAGSTIDGVTRIGDALAAAATREVRGDLIELDGPAIAEYLRRNLRPLAAGHVLEHGGPLAEATARFEVVTAVAATVARATLQWLPEAGATGVVAQLWRQR